MRLLKTKIHGFSIQPLLCQNESTSFFMRSAFLKFKTSALLVCLSCFVSCEEFVEIEPPVDEIVLEEVFEDDSSAESAVLGLYISMVNNVSGAWGGGLASMTYLTSLSCDDLDYVQNDIGLIEIKDNLISVDNGAMDRLWSQLYLYIFQANSVIEGLNSSTTISEDIKPRLVGEAKFIRAFNYFYLVNLFGDVPLLTTTNVQTNSTSERSLIPDVYDQIIQDLNEAIEVLPSDYSLYNDERMRATEYVVHALLARVYLYLENWTGAEEQSTSVINNSAEYSLSSLSDVFLVNNVEAILQMAPFNRNAWQGSIFITNSTPQLRQFLRQELLDSFEIGDNRLTDWIGEFNNGTSSIYYPFKYKQVNPNSQPVTEYPVFLRLAEQYLIRSEARAHQNNIMGAQSDLNLIRSRAGLENTNATDQTSLLAAIENERRVEFFAEMGHRWLDLKRTNRADALLGPLKQNWESTDVLYPIPSNEIELNPNLTQNAGY